MWGSTMVVFQTYQLTASKTWTMGTWTPHSQGPQLNVQHSYQATWAAYMVDPPRVAEGGENATTAGLFKPRHMDASVSGAACGVCMFMKGFVKVGATNMKGYGTLNECSGDEDRACGCGQGMMPSK